MLPRPTDAVHAEDLLSSHEMLARYRVNDRLGLAWYSERQLRGQQQIRCAMQIPDTCMHEYKASDQV